VDLDILTMLTDYGSMGILAGTLWYQNREQSKERRAVTAAFQEQIDRIREQSKEDQAELRDRYMTVIEKYDGERSLFFEERTALRSNLAAQIRDVEQSIAALNGKVDGLQLSIESILTQLRELSTERRLERVAQSAAESKIRSTG
jgi:chromosome segregation ATPase